MWKRCTCFAFLIVLLALIQGGAAFGAFNALKDPAIIGWWTCDEGEGSTVADSSPNGNDGTFINGDPMWTTGIYGNAITLVGPTLVEIQPMGLTLSAATMAGWLYAPTAQPEWASIIMHRSPGPASGFNVLADRQLAYHWNDASNTWSFRGNVLHPLNEWAHCAVTVAPDKAVFYLNGVESAVNNVAHPACAWDGPVWLGGDGGSGWVARRMNGGSLDDVCFFSRALAADEIVEIMGGLTDPALASLPDPADGATDVPRDADLAWSAGESAATHDVYFGTSLADVDAATRANPIGVLVSQGQAATNYVLDRLEFGQTCYWRVDEVEAGGTIYKGDVWSFQVEPFAYAVPNVIATSNGAFDAANGPEKTVDGSGLNAADQHSVEADDMWVSFPPADGSALYIQYEFDGVYKLHELQVWNYNVMFEKMLGFGLKNVTVEYSTDGAEWTALGDIDLNQATAKATYVYNSTIDFQGLPVRYVKLTVNSGFGMLGQYGLSEVRFMYVPVQPRWPQPADGATNVNTDAVLSWRAGREAASHEVYLGTDAEAMALLGTSAQASIPAGTLDLATTYHWKVVEVNAVEAISSWEGGVWSFTTRPFAVVDNFESYGDDIEAGEAIFDTWLDGWVNDTGSTVGHFQAPFAEQSTVNNGKQSMPLFYENTGGISVAEAERTFDAAQDWTASGVKTLAVYFYGTEGNTGQMYLKINNTKVVYNGEASDIAKAQWQLWAVDLTGLSGLQRVTKMVIGVEGAGASGTLYIDDIRLYPDEIELVTPVQPDTTGLILKYTFDAGSGTTVADASGNGNTGTINGNPQWITGVSGSALSFDGSRDYVSTGKSLLNNLPQFTIACWLKGDLSLGNRSGLIGQNDCMEYGVVSANTCQIWTAGGGSVDLTWPYGAAGGWHHIVAVGDGTSIQFYLDGKPAASGGTTTAGYGTSTFFLSVGGGGIFDATDNWFAGQIDEIYVYRRALSAAEVAGLAGRTAAMPMQF